MAEHNVKPEQAAEPEQQERDRWINRVLLPLFLFLAVLVLLCFVLSMLQVPIRTDVLRILLILIGGLLPAIVYLSFIQGRLPILRNEYKQNLRRLGCPENAQQYQDKFDVIYGQKPESGRLLGVYSPIVTATLLAVTGWLLVFFPPLGQPAGLVPNPTPLAYGFLGAYIFGLGSLVRQYVTDDLQIRYYASLVNRYLVVFILSWLVTLLVQPGDEGAALPAGSYLLAAFVIGLFPSTGLRVAQRLGTAALGIVIQGFKETHPLSQLDGLNAYHEDRLLLEGIENLQNLCCAKIVDLMLKTRYPVEQIVDWIDQALLHLHARERIEDFQKSGLRTATDFLDAYDVPGLPAGELTRRREDLARLLDSHHAGEMPEAQLAYTLVLLETMASALQRDPNLFHVCYWRGHEYDPLPEDIERDRTAADLRLVQGQPDEAIINYDKVLQDFPNSPTVLLYRGLAHFALKEYSQAIDDYTTAIEFGGPHWGSARHAYVERGRTWQELKEYARAAQDYQYVLKTYEASPEVHFKLAEVQVTYLYQYDEAIDHLKTVIDAGFEKAKALASLGRARYKRWQQREQPAELCAPELEQARDDLERALRLEPGLTPAWLSLAKVLEALGRETEAIQILTDTLLRLKTVPDPENAYRACLHRGNLCLAQNDYRSAADDYVTATQLVPSDAAAFFNLGVAYQHLGQRDSAISAFRDAIRLKPGHALAHQRLGDVYLVQGLLNDAEKAYVEALKLTRLAKNQYGQALAHLDLAKFYRRLGDRQLDAWYQLQPAFDLAEKVANSAKNIDSSAEDRAKAILFSQVSYELGLWNLDMGKIETAVEQLKNSAELLDVLEDVRASAEAYLQLGRAYLAQQNSVPAVKSLEKARQQLYRVFDPQNPGDAQLQRDVETELARCRSRRE
jgi:tetratricopeptide (TPR) repeat protein